MTNLELANAMRHDLFADRGTDLGAALAAAYQYIDSIQQSDRIAAFTALHLMLNTVSNIIKDNEFKGESA